MIIIRAVRKRVLYRLGTAEIFLGSGNAWREANVVIVNTDQRRFTWKGTARYTSFKVT